MKIYNLFMIITITTLVGCGGGGGGGSSSSGSGSSSYYVSGKGIDGYIKGATVCLDLNLNHKCDGFEPKTTTNETGDFSLEITSEIKSHKNYLKAPLVLSGGIDTETNKPYEGFLTTTPNLGKAKMNITPLTTITGVHSSELISTETARTELERLIKESEDEVLTSLGLGAETKIDKDFIETKDVDLAKVALKLESSSKMIKESLSDTDLHKSYKLIAKGIKETKDDPSSSKGIETVVTKAIESEPSASFKGKPSEIEESIKAANANIELLYKVSEDIALAQAKVLEQIEIIKKQITRGKVEIKKLELKDKDKEKENIFTNFIKNEFKDLSLADIDEVAKEMFHSDVSVKDVYDITKYSWLVNRIKNTDDKGLVKKHLEKTIRDNSITYIQKDYQRIFEGKTLEYSEAGEESRVSIKFNHDKSYTKVDVFGLPSEGAFWEYTSKGKIKVFTDKSRSDFYVITLITEEIVFLTFQDGSIVKTRLTKSKKEPVVEKEKLITKPVKVFVKKDYETYLIGKKVLYYDSSKTENRIKIKSDGNYTRTFAEGIFSDSTWEYTSEGSIQLNLSGGGTIVITLLDSSVIQIKDPTGTYSAKLSYY